MRIPDSIDRQIVKLLGQDALQNSMSLAMQLNLSAATVRRRLRELIRNKSLRIVGTVDPTSFGLPVATVITLDISHDKLASAMEWLASQPEIIWVSTTTGRFDIIAFGRFASTDSLSKFLTDQLSKMEGVRNSETFLCLDVKKGLFVVLS